MYVRTTKDLYAVPRLSWPVSYPNPQYTYVPGADIELSLTNPLPMIVDPVFAQCIEELQSMPCIDYRAFYPASLTVSCNQWPLRYVFPLSEKAPWGCPFEKEWLLKKALELLLQHHPGDAIPCDALHVLYTEYNLTTMQRVWSIDQYGAETEDLR